MSARPSRLAGAALEPLLTIDELAKALGVSRRSIERARARGAFPWPDARLGRVVLWRPETVAGWLEKGGGR